MHGILLQGSCQQHYYPLPISVCQMACGNRDSQVQFTAAKRLLKIALAELSRLSNDKNNKSSSILKKLPQICHSLHSASSAHLYLSASILPECFPCVLCQHHSRFFLRIRMYFILGTEDTIGWTATSTRSG